MNIIVVKIIDRYSVVVNKGSNDGVKKGSRFLIFAEDEEIKDPETGESLGRLEIPKGYAIVESLQEKIAILKSDRSKRQTTRYKNSLGVAAIMGYQEEEEQINLPFERDVSIGDKVKILS